MASRISRCHRSRSTTPSWFSPSRRSWAFLLGLSSITVPWDTLILSVVLYIVVPVIVAQLWRTALLRQGGPAALSRMLSRLAPLSLCALLLTLVLLFGLQGEQIIRQPLVIAMLAVPIWCRSISTRALPICEPGARRRVVRRGTICADRREQFLRAGGCHGYCAVRLPVRRGVGDGRRCPC